MKKLTTITILLMFGVIFSPTTLPAVAQSNDQIEALKGALTGQRMRISFRDGGALYGTYYVFDVQFCQTGRYITSAQSTKTTVMDNEQVNRWIEVGWWEIISYQNQPLLKYVTSQGKINVVPARLLQGGNVWLGDGVSVQPVSTTVCK